MNLYRNNLTIGDIPQLDVVKPIFTVNDTFNGTSLDTTIWDSYVSGGSIGVSSGNLIMSCNNNKAYVYSKKSLTSRKDIDATFKVTSSSGTYNEAKLGIMLTYNTSNELSDYITVTQSSYDNTLRLNTRQDGGSSFDYNTSWNVITSSYTLRIVFTASTRNIKVYVNDVLKIDQTPNDNQIPTDGALVGVDTSSWTSCSISVDEISASAGADFIP